MSWVSQSSVMNLREGFDMNCLRLMVTRNKLLAVDQQNRNKQCERGKMLQERVELSFV